MLPWCTCALKFPKAFMRNVGILYILLVFRWTDGLQNSPSEPALGSSLKRQLISNIAVVTSASEFVAAFANPTVQVMYISAAELLVPQSAWTSLGVNLPIVITRDLDLRGDLAHFQLPIVNLYNVKGKLRLANNVTLAFTDLFVIGARNQSTRAPGLDILAPSNPGELSFVSSANAGVDLGLCFPINVLADEAQYYLQYRPPQFPGQNIVDLNVPQDGCVNNLTAPPMQRCWAMRTYAYDLAANGADYAMVTDATAPNNVVFNMINTTLVCSALVDERCLSVEKKEPLVCYLKAQKLLQAAAGSPPPLELRPPTVADSVAVRTGGSSGSAAGGVSHSGSAIVGAVVGAVAGGLLVLVVLVSAVVLASRRRWQQRRTDEGSAAAAVPSCTGGCSSATERISVIPAAAADGAAIDTGAAEGVECVRGDGRSERGEASCAEQADTGFDELSNAARAWLAGDGLQQQKPDCLLGAPQHAYDLPVTPFTRPRSEVTLGVEFVGLDAPSADDDAQIGISIIPDGVGGVLSSGQGTAAGTAATPGKGAGGARRAAQGTAGQSGGTASSGAAFLGIASSKRGSSTAAVSVGATNGGGAFRSTATLSTNQSDGSAVSGAQPPVVGLLPEVLGKGSFGRVVVGLLKGQRVAVKMMAQGLPTAGSATGSNAGCPDQAFVRSFIQEVQVLSRVQHPNIVQLLAACATPPRLCLVMELMETSLDRLLYGSRSRINILPLEKVLHIGIKIANALAYLHPTIVHRDLKPANVLVNNSASDTPIVKLTDFGLSRLRITEASTNRPDVGTPPYMAPECFDVEIRCTPHQSDMYSLGVLLWEMLAGLRPWEGIGPVAIAFMVTYNKCRLPLDTIPAGRCPAKLSRFLAACWEAEPRRRPAAAEAVKTLTLVLQELQQHKQQQGKCERQCELQHEQQREPQHEQQPLLAS